MKLKTKIRESIRAHKIIFGVFSILNNYYVYFIIKK